MVIVNLITDDYHKYILTSVNSGTPLELIYLVKLTQAIITAIVTAGNAELYSRFRRSQC